MQSQPIGKAMKQKGRTQSRTAAKDKKPKRQSQFWSGATKPFPGTVYVRKGSNRLYIEYKGIKKATGLTNTKANVQIAIAMVTDLWRESHGYPTLKHIKAVVPPTLLPHQLPQQPIHEGRGSREEQTQVRYSEAIAEYRDVYLASRDLAPKTIKGYLNAIDIILQDQTATVTYKNLMEQVQSWLITADQHYNPTSINIHLRGLRTFTSWLRKRKKVIDDDIEYGDHWRKNNVEAPVLIYTDETCTALITYFETCDAPRGQTIFYLREMALLLRFMLATGTRIKETLMLKKSQVLQDRISLPNKNKRTPDYYPITDEIQAVLDGIAKLRKDEEAYLKKNKKARKTLKADRKNYVFRWSYSSQSRLLSTVKRAMQFLGLDAKKGFHTFRRTFCDRLYQADVEMYTRQKLLRHRNIATTINSYSYTNVERLAQALDNVEKRKGKKIKDKVHSIG